MRLGIGRALRVGIAAYVAILAIAVVVFALVESSVVWRVVFAVAIAAEFVDRVRACVVARCVPGAGEWRRGAGAEAAAREATHDGGFAPMANAMPVGGPWRGAGEPIRTECVFREMMAQRGPQEAAHAKAGGNACGGCGGDPDAREDGGGEATRGA